MTPIVSEQIIISILYDLYSWGRMRVQKWRKPGMYEVLNYESTLEIMDPRGMVGKFQKSERVRFLQDNVIAIQDQVWGFGKNIFDYKCSPGEPVDFYESGHKTLVVISLREIRSKNDEIDLIMQWYLKGESIGKMGSWETYINQYTRRITLNIIFPSERPPIRIWVNERNKKRIIELGKKALSELPDKKWQLSWEKKNPVMYETYSLNWEW
jgi:hypothetical protein